MTMRKTALKPAVSTRTKEKQGYGNFPFNLKQAQLWPASAHRKCHVFPDVSMKGLVHLGSGLNTVV